MSTINQATNLCHPLPTFPPSFLQGLEAKKESNKDSSDRLLLDIKRHLFSPCPRKEATETESALGDEFLMHAIHYTERDKEKVFRGGEKHSRSLQESVTSMFFSLAHFGTGSLQIMDSQETDQGEYECVAENSKGTEYSYSAQLYVRGEEG